jgi:hypothetical protein
MGPKTGLIPINCIIDAAKARDMCSGRKRKPISRATFARWRKKRGFPEPIREFGIGELWDRREVRDWLRANGIWAMPKRPDQR